MSPTQRTILGWLAVVAGMAAIAAAEVYLRAPLSAPAFEAGRVLRDQAGHTAAELVAAGAGVALILTGAILLLSRPD
jgi:hypothetical protein